MNKTAGATERNFHPIKQDIKDSLTAKLIMNGQPQYAKTGAFITNHGLTSLCWLQTGPVKPFSQSFHFSGVSGIPALSTGLAAH